MVKSDTEIRFLVATQKQPLIIPMSEKRFRKIMASKSILQVVKMNKDKNGNNKEVEDKTIEFFCKLKSHQIIKIEGLEGFS